MKCALDLVATATLTAQANAQMEELRRQREAELLRSHTTRFCEKIGEELEALAHKGKQPVTSFHCDNTGNILTSTYGDYADNRLSYRLSGDYVDLNYVKQWFAQYCFDVTITQFGYYRYCWGYQHGYAVEVRPMPECLK